MEEKGKYIKAQDFGGSVDRGACREYTQAISLNSTQSQTIENRRKESERRKKKDAMTGLCC